MMMMSEGVSVPPWGNLPVSGGVDGGGVGGCGGDEMSPHIFAALRHFLPCNDAAGGFGADDEDEAAAMAAAVDAYGGDEFRMYDFKVRRCVRGRSHDWTECPFAHPGEKARRRDPRKYHYSGTACPDFRKGGCKRGDACEYAHGVFECWLHPARYRTQACKDGTACRRRVCFFAHTPEQLRSPPCSPRAAAVSSSSPALADSYDGSPLRRQAFESCYLGGNGSGKSHLVQLSSSPTSTLLSPPRSPPSDSYSPPMSPNDVLASLRQLRLGAPQSSPRSAGSFLAAAGYSSAFGSPKSPAAGIYSLPSTPTRPSSLVTVNTPSGATVTVEPIDLGLIVEEEPPVERVESGRALRAKVFERLSKEATVCNDTMEDVLAAAAPDVGWVSDLIN